MRKKIITFILIYISVIGFAQDQLFKKDNTKLEVKILEINQTEIKYKLFNYPDGPTVILNKSDVALIIYQNGVSEVIKVKEQPLVVQYYNRNEPSNNYKTREQEKLEKFKEVTSTKNLISFNTMDFFNSSMNVSYVREIAKNNAHVYIPLSVGFAAPVFTQDLSNEYNNNIITNFTFERKSFEAGLGINLHTTAKRRVTHFIGPYFGIAQFNGIFQSYENISIGITNQLVFTNHSFVLNRYYFMINNGVLFRISKKFNMMANLAIGVKNDDFIKGENPRSYIINPTYSGLNAFKFGIHFGYRF